MMPMSIAKAKSKIVPTPKTRRPTSESAVAKEVRNGAAEHLVDGEVHDVAERLALDFPWFSRMRS